MILLDRRRLRGIAEVGAWMVGRRQRVRIVGESMIPTLRPGQFVLVDRTRRPHRGELALARHPDEDGLAVVKRVERIDPEGRFVLVSDNPAAGTDSRSWGPLADDAVLGTVTLLLDDPSQLL